MLWMFFVIFNYLQEVNLIKVNPTAWEMSLVEDCNRGLRAEKLRRQQATLDDMKIGYDNEGFNLQVGEPFTITSGQWKALEDKGELVRELWGITHQLYNEESSESGLVTLLVESGLGWTAKAYQRSHYRRNNQISPPLFFRMDMADLDHAVEINSPGGGWPLMHMIQQVCNPEGQPTPSIADSWAKAIREHTQLNYPVVRIPSISQTESGDRQFAEILTQKGILTRIYSYCSALPKPTQFNLIIHDGLQQMSMSANWESIWQAYIHRRIRVEPAPSSIYDSKIMELLIWHPRTRTQYPDAARDLFPYSVLVASDAQVLLPGGGKVGICDVPKRLCRNGNYILKYAGADPIRNRSARQVYKLDNPGNGRYGAQTLIQHAIVDWEVNHEPWIIQERIRYKHPVTFLERSTGNLAEENLNARIMPAYAVNGSVNLIGLTAVYSSNWKVHGNPSSVLCAVNVTD